MSKISENIQAARDTIVTNPFGQFAESIQTLSIAAIFAGMNNGTAWSDYMNNFATNSAQLARLCGQDTAFNNHSSGWARLILAYIVSSGTCGGGTGLCMAVEMPASLKMVLDDLDNAPSPDGSHLLPQEVRPFLPPFI